MAALLAGTTPRVGSADLPSGVTAADIAHLFGTSVAQLVEYFANVTALEKVKADILGQLGSGLQCVRRADQEQCDKLSQLIVSVAADWRVVVMLVATHVQRLRNVDVNSPQATQLAAQARQIYAPLAHILGTHTLHSELHNLAFTILEPANHAHVVEQTAAMMPHFQRVLQRTTTEITATLQADQAFMSQLESISLVGRIKEPHSVWAKMKRNNVDAAGLHDMVALRVVLKARRFATDTDATYEARTQQLCYHVMSLTRRRYASMMERNKDYIRSPKANGYQSLHMTALTTFEPGQSAQPFEIQVRSYEMHQRAEFGWASHWSYKGEGSMDWLSRRRGGAGEAEVKIPTEFASNKEYFNWYISELRNRALFVVVDNHIWDLDPSHGADLQYIVNHKTMRDFYTRLSNMRGSGVPRGPATVNGVVVPAGYQLRNADVVMV